MGNSATAKMFWGFPIDSDSEDKERVRDWEEKYTAAKGCPAPAGEFNRDTYRAWLDKKQPLMKAAGCDVGSHGYEYEDDYVCIAASEVSVEWGEARRLDSLYVVQPEWEAKLKDFCEALGLTYQEPGWYLVVHYG